MWVVFLALLAAVCWGVAPIAAKLALSNVSPLIGMGVRSVVALSFVSAWMAVTGIHRSFGHLNLRTVGWLTVEALLATVVGDALYFYALKQGSASQIGVLMASAPLVTMLVANIVLGEVITPLKVLGAGLVMIGLILVSR